MRAQVKRRWEDQITFRFYVLYRTWQLNFGRNTLSISPIHLQNRWIDWHDMAWRDLLPNNVILIYYKSYYFLTKPEITLLADVNMSCNIFPTQSTYPARQALRSRTVLVSWWHGTVEVPPRRVVTRSVFPGIPPRRQQNRSTWNQSAKKSAFHV